MTKLHHGLLALLVIVCGLVPAAGCRRQTTSREVFDPSSSELRFRRYLQERGVSVERMTPAAGAEAFFDFYDGTKFAVSPGGEGDALRVEWGAVGASDRTRRVTLARDFVWQPTTASDRRERWSLWMTFRVADDSSSAPVSGGRRFTGRDARAACAAFLGALPIYRERANVPDNAVEIGFDPTPP
jgi:hypothetical protein